MNIINVIINVNKFETILSIEIKLIVVNSLHRFDIFCHTIDLYKHFPNYLPQHLIINNN